ncbi:MAG: hypothetical protein HUU20_09470 [Pirellulales bacterium]|nr:hypothetical protein [Pirellulales bacterium]
MKIVSRDGKDLLGCEVVCFADGPAQYLGVLQGREYIRSAGESRDPVPVRIVLPRKAYVYSVRDGKDLGWTDTIETGIEPAVAKLYALLPCRVESLALTGIKDAYDQGAAVDYAVESKTLPQAEIPHVFRVEVTKPDGEMDPLYGRNLHAAKGKAQAAFTLALNDVVGNWKIAVADVASGKTTERSFSVKKRTDAGEGR